jgi:hypothetical protein
MITNSNFRIRLFVFLLLSIIRTFSQDNNYWNQMPGSRSAILGGAVVGGVRDNSAVYYNPGSLSFVDSSSISIAANSFQYETAKLINGGGLGLDYKSKIFQNVPLVTISSSFKIKPKSKSTFGLMVFTKNATSNSFSERLDDSISKNILGTYNECFYSSKNPKIGYIGDFNMATALNETWGGITYSFKLNKHIAIGISPFIAYRNQILSKSFVSRVSLDKFSNYYNSGVESEGYSDISNISLTNIRMLGKLGANFDFNNLKLGLTFMSSSFNIGGKSNVSRDITYHGGVADASIVLPWQDTAAIAYIYTLNDKQNNLKSKYKSPSSIAIGIEYKIKKTIFSFTAEYFMPISDYISIMPDSTNFYRSGAIAPTLSSPIINSAKSNKYLKVLEANKSVLNYAFAIEQSINKNFINAINSLNPKLFKLKGVILSGSYRIDKSFYKKSNNDFWVYKYGYGDTTYTVGQRLNFSDININHFNFGITIERQKSDFHIGLFYSIGSNNNFQSLNNLANPRDNVISNNLGAVPDFNEPSKYIYKSYSLLLGYTYHIK